MVDRTYRLRHLSLDVGAQEQDGEPNDHDRAAAKNEMTDCSNHDTTSVDDVGPASSVRKPEQYSGKQPTCQNSDAGFGGHHLTKTIGKTTRIENRSS